SASRDVTRLVTRADCESVEAGAIPARHTHVLVAERKSAGLLSRKSAGSTPAEDARQHVLVAERIGAGLLTLLREVGFDARAARAVAMVRVSIRPVTERASG